MSRVYAVDRTVSNRIWDLIAEEKDTALAAALQSPLPIFALEVAVLASQNNVLSLPNWLQSRHSDASNVLVQVAIEYLKEIAPRVDARGGKPGDSGAAESKAGAPVTGASVRDILAFLRTGMLIARDHATRGAVHSRSVRVWLTRLSQLLRSQKR